MVSGRFFAALPVARPLQPRLFLQDVILRDAEHLADGVVHALGFGFAGYVWCW